MALPFFDFRPPGIDPKTGLPINPAVNEAAAIGALLERFGMGQGWREATQWIDRSPQRALDPLAAIGDRLGILGNLMTTETREIAEPASGAISAARALVRAAGAEPLVATLPALGPLNTLLSIADPHPETRPLPPVVDDAEQMRANLRRYWEQGSADQVIPGARFAVETAASPSNLIGTRAAANLIRGAGARPVAAMMTRMLDFQDEIAQAAAKTAGQGTNAILTLGGRFPWTTDLSRSGKIGDFSIKLNNAFHKFMTSRFPVTEEMAARGIRSEPMIDLSLPRPYDPLPGRADMPQITRVRGQLKPEELLAQLDDAGKKITAADRKAWDDGLAAAVDKADYRKLNPQPVAQTIETMMDRTEQELASRLAARLRWQTDPTTIEGITDVVRNGATEIDRAGLDFEQMQVYLANQVRSGAMEAAEAARQLREARADYILDITDTHRVINDQIDRAGTLGSSAAASVVGKNVTDEWRIDMADLADQIDMLPRTRQQVREQVEQAMSATPPPGAPDWGYTPLREQLELGQAPPFVERLWNAYKAKDLPTMIANYRGSSTMAQKGVENWARQYGYTQPVTTVDELATLMADIDQGKVLNQNILLPGIEAVQDIIAKTRMDVFEARQAAAEQVRLALNPTPALAEISEANKRYLMSNFSAELGQRRLGRIGAGGLGGGRYEAVLSDPSSQWFRAEASADRVDDLLGELVTDRFTAYAKLAEGAAKRSLKLTQDEIMGLLENPREAIRRGETLLEPKDWTWLQDMYEKWNLNPFPKQEDEWAQTMALLADRMRRDKAESLGDPRLAQFFMPRVLNAIGAVSGAFQEEALAMPSTLLVNLGSGIAIATAFGGNPTRIAANAARNAIAAFKNYRAGRPAMAAYNNLPGDLQDMYRGLEIEPTGNLTAQTRNAIAVQSGTARGRLANQIPGIGEPDAATAIERIHPVIRFMWGAGEGALIGGAAGNVPGALIGGVLGGMARVKFDPEYKLVANALYDGFEGAMRGTATAEAWEKAIPFLKAEQERLLNRSIPSQQMIGPRVSRAQETAGAMTFEQFARLADAQELKPPGNPTRAIQDAQADGTLISARRMREIVLEQGASVDDATRAAREWAGALDDIDDWAAQQANKINFDYVRTNNAEELVRKFMLFPIWPIRAVPLFMEMLVQHPSWIWAIVKLNDMSERENQASNRPDSMRGYGGGAGLGSLIAQAIYAKGGYLAMNPYRPYAGQIENLGSLDETYTTNPVGRAVGVAKNLGFGLRPEWQLALEIAGAVNPAPFELWRSNPMKEAAATTALNLGNIALERFGRPERLPTAVGTAEAPILEARRALRAALAPITGASTQAPSITGSPIKDQMIRRRIVELAYEQNGGRPQGPYLAALNSPDASPDAREIWDAARQDVEKVIAVQTAVNNLAPVRARYISETEQTLRGEKAKVDETRDEAQQTLNQMVAARRVTPDQAAALERQIVRQAEEANPLANATYDLSGSDEDTQQRAMNEFRRFTYSIAAYDQAVQRTLIRKFLNERPDIARAIQRQSPSVTEERYNAVPAIPGGR